MPFSKRRENLRNIAIVAHVDHGKTTLVDALLKQTGAYLFKEGESTIMDSNPLERERGITIFSKNASFVHQGTRFNIVDTPGHADFGSEVERILKMVDGVLLLVDAFDGPMPQTKFVLRKSLELGLKPILVVNKLDRANARPKEVVDLTFDLFCELNATDEQLDFPIVYASAKIGWATLSLDASSHDMTPLLDTILHKVPPPIADVDMSFQMLVTLLDHNPYVGRMAVGRISNGAVKVGSPLVVLKPAGEVERGRVTKIFKYQGLTRVEAGSAEAGDIVTLTGFSEVHVADTLADPENPKAIEAVKIDEPTLSLYISHNTSPLVGKDGGQFLTPRHIRDRLMQEAMLNVGIRVEEVPNQDRFRVSGRGELHLSILLETMRREGYEIEVSRPEVIARMVDGVKMEPIEEVVIEVDPGFEGAVIASLGSRKAEMKNMMHSAVGTIRMEFFIPSRSLLGFRSEFLTLTRGTGIMHQNFYEYQPEKGEIPARPQGVMIAHADGIAVAYALFGLQDRGEIFVHPGDDLYEGMIVGANNKGTDLTVNAVREKKLTNMRSAGADVAIRLITPRPMTLEFALEFIASDELVEVTPKHIRIRKRYRTENERKTQARQDRG